MDPELLHRRLSKRTLGRFQAEESGSGSPPVLNGPKTSTGLTLSNCILELLRNRSRTGSSGTGTLLLLAVVAQDR